MTSLGAQVVHKVCTEEVTHVSQAQARPSPQASGPRLVLFTSRLVVSLLPRGRSPETCPSRGERGRSGPAGGRTERRACWRSAAASQAVAAIDPTIIVDVAADRFRAKQPIGEAVFCCVDNISARTSIWRSGPWTRLWPRAR